MRKTSTYKQFVVTLAALAIISAVLFKRESHQTRDAKIAAQLEHDRDQIRNDDREYEDQRRREIDEQEQFQMQVEALRKKVHPYAEDESKTATSKP
jgi:hypothetical protein